MGFCGADEADHIDATYYAAVRRVESGAKRSREQRMRPSWSMLAVAEAVQRQKVRLVYDTTATSPRPIPVHQGQSTGQL